MNICAITNKPITTPMISLKTGHIFEKEEILNKLKISNNCPITGCKLAIEDLKEIKSFQTINPNSTINVPLLDLNNQLKNEFASIENEISIKKIELSNLNKQISENKFKHESGKLVISRILKEREDLLDKIEFFSQLHQEAQKKQQDLLKLFEENENTELEMIGMYQELIDNIKLRFEALFGLRKQRKADSTIVPFNKLSSALIKKEIVTTGINKINNLTTSYFKTETSSNNLVFYSNENNEICLLNSKTNKVFNLALNNIRKNVNDIKLLRNFNHDNNSVNGIFNDIPYGLSISSYCNSSFFKFKDNTDFSNINIKDVEEIYTAKFQNTNVINSCQHSLSKYAVIVAENGEWSYHNIEKNIQINKIETNPKDSIGNNYYLKSSSLHSDGLLLALGDNKGIISCWDITSEKVVNTIDSHSSKVNTLAFSENGYNLMSCSYPENSVKIWDFRKADIAVKAIKLSEDYKINSVKYNAFGNYIGVCGSDFRVYNTKSTKSYSEPPQIFESILGDSQISDFSFGNNCSEIFLTNRKEIAVLKQE